MQKTEFQDVEINASESGKTFYNLTQQQIREYLLNVIRSNDKSPDENALEIMKRILPEEISKDVIDDKGETNWDRIYRELPSLYEEDYEFAHVLEGYVGGDGYMVKPEVFLDTIISANALGEKYEYFVEDALSSLNYVFTFHDADNACSNYFKDKLDFDNPENFERTARVMDFLGRLFNLGQGEGFWSRVGRKIADVLPIVLSNDGGSYLLQIKARELLENINKAFRNMGYIYTEEDNTTFEISKNIKARHDSHGRLIIIDGSDPSVSKSITDILPGNNMQEKMSLARDYSYMMRPQMRRLIAKEFGVKLTELGLSEQVYFLDFIKSKPSKEVKDIQNFAKEYGKDGLRTFLSLQHGKDFGNKIVRFGNETEPTTVHTVFKKYGELVDAATSVTEYLKGEFGRNKEYGPEVIEEVTDKMLRAGRAILEKFVADKISEGEDRPLQNVGKELEKTRVDIISFTSAFKTLKETGIEFSLSDVKDLEISTVNSSDISDKDIKFMEKLYSLNYIRYPKLADYLVNKFNEAMHDPASTVSILRRNGEIVAFYRLEPNGQENSFYFGSFNVDPTYQGSSLGETLMQESLDVKAKDNIIFAECNPKVAVSANYIERGFIAVNSGHIEEIDILNIVRNDKMNTKLASRALSMNDILDGRFPNDKINVRTIPINNLSDLSFDFVGSKHGVQTEVLTRYIRDKKAGFIYLVTEQVDDSFVEQYSSSAQFIPQPNSEMEAVAA